MNTVNQAIGSTSQKIIRRRSSARALRIGRRENGEASWTISTISVDQYMRLARIDAERDLAAMADGRPVGPRMDVNHAGIISEFDDVFEIFTPIEAVDDDAGERPVALFDEIEILGAQHQAD